ncbi:MAG: DEAD/DEAH box helicase [bacterium]|nr:DEAD/DEAH box helicase [bacterium]
MKEKDLEIKESLGRVWDAFFSHYTHLLPIQREAIPSILSKRNLLLVSPAATGKTEAVCAPIARLLQDETWQGLSVLYITPTRALVNDLYRRLKPPLDYLGIEIKRKTGDRQDFDPRSPSQVLLTTPESFDSLLSRHPKVFRNLRVICLDELHLYDNTYRGDELRVLLERIKLLRKKTLHFYGLSATISYPYKIGRRYFSDFDIIVDRTPREIDYTLHKFSGDIKSILSEFKKKGLCKVLIFCNTRKSAEDIALKIKKAWPYSHFVWVHHASLNKREREVVEQEFNRAKLGIIAATMTLELGIDIGDIDAVVFVSPPSSCFSLLQRLGRGNRRENKITSFGLYSNKWERILFEVMFRSVKHGWIEEEIYTPRLSVACQQIFSYVYQKRRTGTPISSIVHILQPLSLDEVEIKIIIDHLIDMDYLKSGVQGLLFIGEKLEYLVERGLIHSNIEKKREEYQVIDGATGGVVGKIEGLSPSFVLKGKLWMVQKVWDSKVWVKEKGGLLPSKKVFHGKGQALWDWRLGMRLKLSLFPGIGEDKLPYIKKEGSIYLFHFLGLIYGYIWAEALVMKGLSVLDVEGIYLLSHDLEIEDLMDVTREEIKLTVDKVYKGISKFLNLGSWFWLLPDRLKLEAVRAAIDIERMYSLIKGSTPYAATSLVVLGWR